MLEYMHDSQCSCSRHNLADSNSIEAEKCARESHFWKAVGVCMCFRKICCFCFVFPFIMGNFS